MSKISEVRIWPQEGGKGGVLARGDFLYDDALRIKFTLREGESGRYVGMPGRYAEKKDPETGKAKWYSDVFIKDEKLRDELNEVVIAKFNQEAGGPSSQGQASGPTDQTGGTKKKNLPF